MGAQVIVVVIMMKNSDSTIERSEGNFFFFSQILMKLHQITTKFELKLSDLRSFRKINKNLTSFGQFENHGDKMQTMAIKSRSWRSSGCTEIPCSGHVHLKLL